MPVQINQPSNQIRLTNVSLVRMKKGKKRYEIACYKNKVLEYRSGAEKDLDNVLQIPNVFLSVSKGQAAPKDDLAKSFGKDKTLDDIILEILKKGELQVGDKERAAALERVHNEVIDIVAGKLVDPRSKRVYTAGMIEKALDQLSAAGAREQQELKAAGASHANSGTATPSNSSGGGDSAGITTKAQEQQQQRPTWSGVVTTKSSKSQALDAMKALIAWQPIPVTRARMRLRITCPTGVLKLPAKVDPANNTSSSSAAEGGGSGGGGGGTVKDRLMGYVEQVESQDVLGEEWEVVGFVEPGAFKSLTEFVGTQTKGRARAEVLDMAVHHEGE